jgi:hypothetical protein
MLAHASLASTTRGDADRADNDADLTERAVRRFS